MIDMKRLGIYVHIPFCIKKCGYCDFYSVGADEERKKEYIEALIKEIEGEDSKKYKEFAVKTIYFGGGTPSLLPAEFLGEVLKTIRQNFQLSEEEGYPEITVECNPEAIEYEKLLFYKEMGVNRISIGLQSANDEELKLLGRVHSYEKFLESHALVRKAGFQNVNVDVMSGLPTQTMESYRKTVEEVIRLNPEHIASYSLILEEGTPFFKKYSEGEKMARLLPNEEVEREMYYFTDKRLKEAGYERYEISNYAKKGYASRHNSSYWERIPYLGFGVAAASQFEKKRWVNVANLKEYIVRIEEGQSVKTEEIELSRENEIEETMFLGLRMSAGVEKERFFRNFRKDIYEVYPDVLKKQIQNDFLEDRDGFIRLTEKGIDVSNQILCEFLLD